LHNLHRFKEAEPLARRLVAERGIAFDFGLLGDVSMEQGDLRGAAAAYQKMVDLRPDLHSYTRGAHLRWLKGKLNGAIELMRLAAGAASPQDAESAAWVYTRLAGYEFQAGSTSDAWRDCETALGFQKDYPPALLLEGRMELAAAHAPKAVELLRAAESKNPLPEYQWALIEALKADGQAAEAEQVARRLDQRGASADPRTYSLYLSSTGRLPDTALKLAREEFNTRGDIFTEDALAWALAASGNVDDAKVHMRKALREGTSDARLFMHAAVIASRAGDIAEAHALAARAANLQQLLLPSERRQLDALEASARETTSIQVPNKHQTVNIETVFPAGNN
jgi:tetratricopeptide (TPR) repeat protein